MSAEGVVHIVDDDPRFARALGRLLNAHGLQVRAFPSGAALLASVSDKSRGCVVTDLHMPQLSGLQLQEELAGKGVAMPVLFLTGRGDVPSSVQAMRRGAVDFLEKHAAEADLIGAVRRALDSDTAAFASRAKRDGLRARFAALSERELQVLRQVVRGRMNKQIAADLGIHERTVKLHRSAITSKMGVRSSAELATLARDAGLD